MMDSITRQRSRGQALLIVLITIFVLSALGSLLMTIIHGKRVYRQNLQDSLQLFYLADAGVINAFHKLKAGMWQKRWYYSGQGTLDREIGAGKFTVTVTDIPGEKKARIRSQAAFKNKTLVINALAHFSVKTERLSGYRTPRTKITCQWKLEYKL